MATAGATRGRIAKRRKQGKCLAVVWNEMQHLLAFDPGRSPFANVVQQLREHAPWRNEKRILSDHILEAEPRLIRPLHAEQ